MKDTKDLNATHDNNGNSDDTSPEMEAAMILRSLWVFDVVVAVPEMTLLREFTNAISFYFGSIK